MQHLGDITKIDGAAVKPANVIIGGSPCQDLSVAGKQNGFSRDGKATRSGIFMEQLRIIREMREKDIERANKNVNPRPRYMVWENVPGAFSSNGGADFAIVLEETVRIICEKAPPVPVPKNGWPNAGCLSDMGGKWSLAWRVFDAQFWGVPQRRKRIALVADFAGLAAPEILFEREDMLEDTKSGTAARESSAGRDVAGVVIPINLRNATRSSLRGGRVRNRNRQSRRQDGDNLHCPRCLIYIARPGRAETHTA